MSTAAERKCALLLASLRRRDRRRALSALPVDSARRVRTLVAQLDALGLPIDELANEVLADEIRGLTATTSLDLDALMRLSDQLAPAWFARVLAVSPHVNPAFCLSTLEAPAASAVRRDLALLPALPPRLAGALQAESARLAAGEARS